MRTYKKVSSKKFKAGLSLSPVKQVNQLQKQITLKAYF